MASIVDICYLIIVMYVTPAYSNIAALDHGGNCSASQPYCQRIINDVWENQGCNWLNPGSAVGLEINITFRQTYTVSAFKFIHCYNVEHRNIRKLQMEYEDGSTQEITLQGWNYKSDLAIHEPYFISPTTTKYVHITVISEYALSTNESSLNASTEPMFGINQVLFYQHKPNEKNVHFNVAQNNYGSTCSSTYPGCAGAIDNIIEGPTLQTNNTNKWIYKGNISDANLTITFFRAYTISSCAFYQLYSYTDERGTSTCNLTYFKRLQLSFSDGSIQQITLPNENCTDILENRGNEYMISISPVTTTYVKITALTSYPMLSQLADEEQGEQGGNDTTSGFEEVMFWATEPVVPIKYPTRTPGTAINTTAIGLWFALALAVVSLSSIFIALFIRCRTHMLKRFAPEAEKIYKQYHSEFVINKKSPKDENMSDSAYMTDDATYDSKSSLDVSKMSISTDTDTSTANSITHQDNGASDNNGKDNIGFTNIITPAEKDQIHEF